VRRVCEDCGPIKNAACDEMQCARKISVRPFPYHDKSEGKPGLPYLEVIKLRLSDRVLGFRD
jgi:hypothetical protein